MELRDLRYFLSVAEEMSFSRAAEKIHLSQPPLSRHIKELEEYLGVKLFERNGRSLKLTEAGEYFQIEAARLLENVKTLTEDMRNFEKGRGSTVRIGYVASLAGTLLPDLIFWLETRSPEFSFEFLEMSTESQVDALLKGKIDLGLLRSWIQRDGLNFTALAEENLSLILPISWIQDLSEDTLSGVSGSPRAHSVLTKLAGKAFLSQETSKAPGLFEKSRNLCRTYGNFYPKIRMEVSNFDVLLKLVAAGRGWTISPILELPGAYESLLILPFPSEGAKVIFGIGQIEGEERCQLQKIRGLLQEFFNSRWETIKASGNRR